MRAAGALLVLIGLTFVPAYAEVTPVPNPTDPPTQSPTPTPTPTSPVPDDRNDPTRAAQYWLDDLGIREAWNTTLGEGVKIAVIDTGVGWFSPTFDGVVGGTDASGIGSPDGRDPIGPNDPGHGSRVASLAAGREAANGSGMIGVAPRAEVLSISLGFETPSAVGFGDQVANAIVWAVDNGADIINLSFTINSPNWPRSWDDAFQHAFDNDVLIIVAAGNRGSGTTTVGAPATIPGVLTVAGVDREGRPSESASTQGVTVGLAAPSEALIGVEADGEVMAWSGTSGAAPIVAGVAALVRSAHPDLDTNNVIQRLVATAKPAAEMQQYPDPLVGYGIVDANAAVNDPVDWVDYNPTADMSLERWIELYRPAEAEEQPEEVEAQPRTVEPLPPLDEASVAGSPWIPSRDSVLRVSIPLVILTTAGILVGLGVTAAARLMKSARKPRA